LDPEEDLPGTGVGDGNVVEPEIPGAVEDLGSHASRPDAISTKTLRAARSVMSSTASARRSSGNRCEASRSTFTSPAQTSVKASARSAGDDEYVAPSVSS